jgi:hypothetical protein
MRPTSCVLLVMIAACTASNVQGEPPPGGQDGNPGLTGLNWTATIAAPVANEGANTNTYTVSGSFTGMAAACNVIIELRQVPQNNGAPILVGIMDIIEQSAVPPPPTTMPNNTMVGIMRQKNLPMDGSFTGVINAPPCPAESHYEMKVVAKSGPATLLINTINGQVQEVSGAWIQVPK